MGDAKELTTLRLLLEQARFELALEKQNSAMHFKHADFLFRKLCHANNELRDIKRNRIVTLAQLHDLVEAAVQYERRESEDDGLRLELEACWESVGGRE